MRLSRYNLTSRLIFLEQIFRGQVTRSIVNCELTIDN